MAFEPIRMTSPSGFTVPVGSAVDREHLLSIGYAIEAPEPAPAPAVEPVTKAEEKPVSAVEDKPAVNVTRKSTTK
jgi:hypothetical protein